MRSLIFTVAPATLWLACTGEHASAPSGSKSLVDTAEPAGDTHLDTGEKPQDTSGAPDDTGESCASPSLLAPVGVDLWRSSRYDLVLTGADGAALDGAELPLPAAGRVPGLLLDSRQGGRHHDHRVGCGL